MLDHQYDNNLYGYEIPLGMRVYSIGDIHGEASLLDEIHHAIKQDLENSPVVLPYIIYLGDYIDRGPDSAGVLSRLTNAAKSRDGITRVFLEGNHENFAKSFLIGDRHTGEFWLKSGQGGREALKSYGIKDIPMHEDDLEREMAFLISEFNIAAREREHVDFLESLDSYKKIGDYLFVHAGIMPKVPLEKQKLRDLTRIRGPFLTSEYNFGMRIVHGHSMTLGGKPVVKSNRIAVDTGAFQTGILTCAVLEGQGVRFLQTHPAKKEAIPSSYDSPN